MSGPTSLWLLDKNIVRNASQGLAKLDLGQPLTADDLQALDVLRAIRERRAHGAISPELTNILRRRAHLASVRIMLATLPVFLPARYFKRWARRLRDEGFTREDAKVVALGTFGTDEIQSRFGADAVVTGDLRLVRNFDQRRGPIQRRLKAMTAQLPRPYCNAKLPAVVAAVEAVESLDH